MTSPPTTKTLTRNQYRLALGTCFLTIIVAILDQNIVSAALVPITSDLDPAHGLDLAPWVVTAFTLAGTAAVPLYGRLCDLYGPRRVFLQVVAVFVVGSILCGMSQTMLQLVLFRALQGLGAGGLISVTMIVAAHLTMVKPQDPAKPRKKNSGGAPSGLAGLVFVVGMTVGPPVGGVFADHGIWRWIFYVNLPLGAVILIGALAVFRFPRRPATGSIDFVGTALVAAFAGCLLLAGDWGGDRYAWNSPTIIGLASATVVTLTLFLWRQSVTTSPIMPLRLFTIPAVRNSYIIQWLQGMSLTGVIVYLLMYLQIVRGISATTTGTFLIFLAGGILISGLLAERLDTPTRTAMVAGTATATTALLLLYRLTGPDTSLWLIRGELTLLGLGFGLMIGRLITVVQDAASGPQMGVAIAGVRFFQLLGGATGVALLGTVSRRLYESEAPGVELTTIPTLTGAAHTSATTAFADSVRVSFAVAAGFMALAAVFATRLRRPDPTGSEHAPPQPTTAPTRDVTV